MQHRLTRGNGVIASSRDSGWLNPPPSTPRGMRRFAAKSKAQQDRAKSIYNGPGTKTGFRREVGA